MAILMLSITAISLSSCETIFDEFTDTLIGGREWRQDNYYIESLGGGEYYVENTQSGDYKYFYLAPFYEFLGGRPHNAHNVSYYPYVEYGTLGWHVEAGEGRCYFISPESDHWDSHKNHHRN